MLFFRSHVGSGSKPRDFDGDLVTTRFSSALDVGRKC